MERGRMQWEVCGENETSSAEKVRIKTFQKKKKKKKKDSVKFSSVQFSFSVVSDSLQPHEAQQASLSITNSEFT